MLKLAYNTTDSAVCDEQGYVIGGGSWGVMDTTDAATKADYDAGRLIDVNEDAARKTDNPDVIVAVAALDSRRERLDEVKGMDKDELIESLPPELLDTLPVGASGEPAKADLVDVVAALPEDELIDAPQPGADEDGFGGDAPEPAKTPAPSKKSTSRAAAKK